VDRTLRNEVVSRRFKTGLQLGVLHANVALAERVARAAGLVLPLMAQTEVLLTHAEDRLGYSNDHSALIKWLETLTPPGNEARETAETKTDPV
jgi:3-hydroxyisobutyrate dehydrogenase-like beta-hydroxyacid dehydrogenase